MLFHKIQEIHKCIFFLLYLYQHIVTMRSCVLGRRMPGTHKGESSSSSCSSSSDDSGSEDEVDCSMRELERKRLHPDRLHPELWFNDPGEVSWGLIIFILFQLKKYESRG
jgi:hypothetical protein